MNDDQLKPGETCTTCGHIVVDPEAPEAPTLPDGATLNADGSVTLVLKYPKEWMKQPLTELVIGRPTARNMRDLNMATDKQVSSLLDIGASMAGKSPRCIDIIDGLDCFALLKVVQYFLPTHQVIGV